MSGAYVGFVLLRVLQLVLGRYDETQGELLGFIHREHPARKSLERVQRIVESVELARCEPLTGED